MRLILLRHQLIAFLLCLLQLYLMQAAITHTRAITFRLKEHLQVLSCLLLIDSVDRPAQLICRLLEIPLLQVDTTTQLLLHQLLQPVCPLQV